MGGAECQHRRVRLRAPYHLERDHREHRWRASEAECAAGARRHRGYRRGGASRPGGREDPQCPAEQGQGHLGGRQADGPHQRNPGSGRKPSGDRIHRAGSHPDGGRLRPHRGPAAGGFLGRREDRKRHLHGHLHPAGGTAPERKQVHRGLREDGPVEGCHGQSKGAGMMEIIKKRIADMERAAYNPRVELRPGDDEYEALKYSLEHFGQVEPIVWNRRTNA